jgi:signal peptidase I
MVSSASTSAEFAVPRSKLAIILIAIFPGIVPLMLFLGRGRLALIYAGLQILWLIAVVFIVQAFNAPLLIAGFDFETILLTIGLLPTLAALIHALIIRCNSLARPVYSRWFISLIAVPALIFGLVVCFRTLGYQPFSIPSGSMHPTLIVGDHLFVSKWTYGWSRFSLPWKLVNFQGRMWSAAAERGDIVIFRLPGDEDADYTARVIGLPGERIRVTDGVVHIDGAIVKKERIEDFIEPVGGFAQPQYRETLPNGVSYRVLDLDPNSGADNTDAFLVPAGHYFMLGDNRDNSMDSRFPQVGFVPDDHLIGRAELLYWNALAVPIDGRLGGDP